MIPDCLNSQAASDMAIALLHTLWQGMIIAVILFFILKSTSGSRSELRYRLSVISLFVIVLCWLGTFSILQYEMPLSDEATIAAEEATIQTKQVPTPEASGIHQSKHDQSSQLTITLVASGTQDSGMSSLGYAGWAVTLWAAGVCVMLARMFWALAGAAKLKRNAVDIEDPAIVELFAELCKRMNIRRKIRFAASKTLAHPGVIGFFRPVLLIPMSILSEISMDDLQAILAHELAHIRRFDYLINFCQMVVEAVLFFNPAVWWISRRIRIEREVCCDVAGVATVGQRVQYARVLFEQIAKTSISKPPLAAAITGFSEENTTVSEERIHRIIHPQNKPRMKIGWVKLACWLVVAGGILLGLWKTTDMTVELTAKVMTPTERMEKMAEIARTHSGEYRSYNDTDQVTLSGKVTTYDGKPLPKHSHINIEAYNSRSSYHTSIDIDRNTGTFKNTVQCMENVLVSIAVEGYAPAFSKEYHPEPNEIIENIELVLTEGFGARVKIVNEEGDVIPNAALQAFHFLGKNKGNWSGLGNSRKTTSDNNGLAIFEHQNERPVKLSVQADGYQKIENETYTFKADELMVIQLKKGLTAEGTVVSKATGEPIAGAQLRLVYKDKSGHGYGYGSKGILETISDENGKFCIDTLNPEWTSYYFIVAAEGYNRFALSMVEPGAKNLNVKMEPELHIKGKIVGDLSQLKKSYCEQIEKSALAVRYNSRFEEQEYNHYYENRAIPVEVIDGVGYFTLNNILGDKVVLRPVGTEQRITVKMDKGSVGDLVIDLDAPNNFYNLSTRPVVLTFTSPEGYPPVEGTAEIWYMTKTVEQSDHRQWTGIDMVVENGVGKVDFPVPAYLRLAETKGLKGFWIEPKPWRTEKENLVTAGDKPYKRTIVAEPAGSIYGQVLDEQGRLKRNAQIKLLLVEWPEKYENYDSNQLHQIKNEITDFFHGYNATETGRFSTHALPMGGTYAIVAFDENTWLVSEPIKLTEEKPIREVTLHLEETTQIGGRILLPDKSPAKGVEVSLGASVRYSKEDGQGNTGFTIKTDENGTFLFEEINPQKPLKYTLRIKPGAGYQPLNVKVKPGSDKTYTLKKGYTLKGKIVDDETGWPIPGAWVGAESTADAFDYNRARTCDKPSDKDGNFIFTSLNKERYRLYLGGAEIVPYESRNIDGGQTKEVNLRVKLQSWSQLKPRKPDNEAP